MSSTQEQKPRDESEATDTALDETPDIAVADTTASDTAGADTRPVRSWRGVRALLVRLHFYTGVFVAPFLLVAALTGLAYTFTPQLDDVVYGDVLHVEQSGRQPRPLADQISAARAAHPEGTLASVTTPPGPGDTTQVVLSVPELGEKQRTVFVDPYTAEVKGELTTWWGSTPLTTWLDDLHRNLHLGETGRLYSEVAASWLWVLVAGGLVLWLGRARGQRARSARGVLLPDQSARGVRRTRGRHAATGVWIALGLLFLSATGLTWSHYAGDRFGQLLDTVRGHAPELDTALPGAKTAAGDEHAGHAGHHAGQDAASADPAAFDTVLAVARHEGLGGKVVVTPPADPASAWTVAQDDPRWPVHYDKVAVDAAKGEVTAEARWADYPVTAKLTKIGVQGHMGRLFGVANQILLAVIALGLVFVVLWGYRMWWQRRPIREDRTALFGKVPARGIWRTLPLPVLILGVPAVVALGWALPVLGITLLAFLVLDVVTGLVRKALFTA
ncbi:PepSY-associated TM helix domain-containing protein [Streptomyces sp. NPDC086783]|uniref:PepSY-associated TM helix domain-containing protein n=1 Tax=Streptomyces sp. NPDC086783 TaxID=3365758 RepID=UPI003812B5D2